MSYWVYYTRKPGRFFADDNCEYGLNKDDCIDFVRRWKDKVTRVEYHPPAVDVKEEIFGLLS